MEDFNRLYHTKMQPGIYQYSVLGLCAAIQLALGGQTTIIPVIAGSAKDEFSLDTTSFSVINSLASVVTAFISLCAGGVIDRIGRAPVLKVTLLLQIALLALAPFVSSVGQFAALFILVNVHTSVQGIVLLAYVSEMSFDWSRGRWMLAVNVFFTVGKIYGTLLGFAFLEEGRPESWRRLVTGSIPLIILIAFITITCIGESLRFLLVKGRFLELRLRFNRIANINNAFGGSCEHLSDEDMWAMQNSMSLNPNINKNGSIKELFAKDVMFLNILIWVFYLCANISAYGQLMIMPLWFAEKSEKLTSLLVMLSGEIPAVILSFIVIDNKKIGRKKSLIFFSLFATILCFSSLAFSGSRLAAMIFCTRFFVKGMWLFIVTYVSEVYETRVRALALGMANAICYIGGCILPFAIFPMFYWEKYSVFILFGVANFLAFICSTLLPFDTTGRQLDAKRPENKSEQDQEITADNSKEIQDVAATKDEISLNHSI